MLSKQSSRHIFKHLAKCFTLFIVLEQLHKYYCKVSSYEKWKQYRRTQNVESRSPPTPLILLTLKVTVVKVQR